VGVYPSASVSATVDQETQTVDLTVDTDADNDGVPAAEENGVPNGGDGNGDGTPDYQQQHVVSLSWLNGWGYLTLEVNGSCGQAEDVQVLGEAELSETDPRFDYPFGILAFTLPCDSARVTLFFHGSGPTPPLYLAYGPIPYAGIGASWYFMPGVAFGSANVGGKTVVTATFDLTDGSLGDNSQTERSIVHQGGPAAPAAFHTSQPIPVPTLEGFGLGLLALLMLSIVFAFYRSERSL